MSSHSMIYVGIYALIYLHTILHQGMDSRDGLPRGVLPSGILKIEKYCPGHKVPVSKILNWRHISWMNFNMTFYYQITEIGQNKLFFIIKSVDVILLWSSQGQCLFFKNPSYPTWLVVHYSCHLFGWFWPQTS